MKSRISIRAPALWDVSSLVGAQEGAAELQRRLGEAGELVRLQFGAAMDEPGEIVAEQPGGRIAFMVEAPGVEPVHGRKFRGELFAREEDVVGVDRLVGVNGDGQRQIVDHRIRPLDRYVLPGPENTASARAVKLQDDVIHPLPAELERGTLEILCRGAHVPHQHRIEVKRRHADRITPNRFLARRNIEERRHMIAPSIPVLLSLGNGISNFGNAIHGMRLVFLGRMQASSAISVRLYRSGDQRYTNY